MTAVAQLLSNVARASLGCMLLGRLQFMCLTRLLMCTEASTHHLRQAGVSLRSPIFFFVKDSP